MGWKKRRIHSTKLNECQETNLKNEGGELLFVIVGGLMKGLEDSVLRTLDGGWIQKWSEIDSNEGYNIKG